MAKGDLNAVRSGEKIITGGLFLQLLSFGLFVVVAFVFHYRMFHTPTKRGADPSIPWQKHQTALYMSSGLIMVRSIVRVVEYIQGNSGYLLAHEWTLYVFDACLMWVTMLCFNFIHPSEINAMLRGGRYSARAGLEMKYRPSVAGQGNSTWHGDEENIQLGRSK